MELIEKRVKDPCVLKLIKDGLKAKVFTKGDQEYIPELGTPQGGILSPLLSNIYLHEFDMFMERLMEEFQGTRKTRKINSQALTLLRSGRKKEYYGKGVPYYDPKDSEYRMCKYIRYADDFLIAIMGSREMVTEIRKRIAEWMRNELKIELSMEKTHITHISEGVPFLGYRISR